MKRLRTIIFWGHLLIGTIAGLVILVMSATGAALALKPQILRIVERDVRRVEPDGRGRLPVSQLVAAVRTARPDAEPTSLAIERDPTVSAAVGIGPNTVYVDQYSGRVLGAGSSASRWFRTLEDWHRWLGVGEEQRASGRSITGASNIGFLLLGITGIYLWWPRQWSVQHTRAILKFRRTATARARDFNWHNVIGFWCAPVIVVMTATAVVMSYGWANDLLYRMTGSTPPVRNAGGAPAGNRRGEQPRPVVVAPADLDRAWSLAGAQVPAWRTISMRFPTRDNAPAAFTLTDGNAWHAFARSQLTVDLKTGAVRQWQPYSDNSLGQRARTWVRFGHTGELAGLPGQVAAGIACLSGTVLVWTGLSLALRRLFGWMVWQPRFRVSRRADDQLAAVLQRDRRSL